jgi:hypothetical protein
MNDAIILHEGLGCCGDAPPSCYVSSAFVRLHYRRIEIPFTPYPKISLFFGTMFVGAARLSCIISQKLREKF